MFRPRRLGLTSRSRRSARLLWRRSRLVDFLFGFLHRRLEILFDHLHFLLDHVELWFDGLAQVLSRLLKALDRFPDLSSDLWQLLRAKEQKRNDENDQYFAGTQSEHGSTQRVVMSHR